MMKPKRIFLQTNGKDMKEATFCQDRINDDDWEYVLADNAKKQINDLIESYDKKCESAGKLIRSSYTEELKTALDQNICTLRDAQKDLKKLLQWYSEKHIVK